jgi:hypothetical protein
MEGKGLEFILRLLNKIHFNRILYKTHFVLGYEAVMDANITVASTDHREWVGGKV